MQAVTVPKEVIWATRFLWLSVIIPLILIFIVAGMYGEESFFILDIFYAIERKIVTILIGLFLIFGINYFLLKGNKWVMWLVVIILGFTAFMNTITIAAYFAENSAILERIIYLIKIVFYIPIVYLLVKQRAFFK